MAKRAVHLLTVVLIVVIAGTLVWSSHWRSAKLVSSPYSKEKREASAASASVANQSVSSVDIPGCAGSIAIKPGEVLEPRIVPTMDISAVRKIYGPETERHDAEFEWHRQESWIGFYVPKENRQRFVSVNVQPRYKVLTPDGILLGQDTFRSLLAKAKQNGISIRERMEGADGHWILTVKFPSACGGDFESVYLWDLDDDADVERAAGSQTPFHSDIFLDKVVSGYDLGLTSEDIEGVDGFRSIHD